MQFTEIIHRHKRFHILRRKLYLAKSNYFFYLGLSLVNHVLAQALFILTLALPVSLALYFTQITCGTISVDFRTPKGGKSWHLLTPAKLPCKSSSHIPSLLWPPNRFFTELYFWKTNYITKVTYFRLFKIVRS